MNTTKTKTLGITAGAVIVVLTVAAFWLSYAHLHDVAAANGLEGERAWAWPATLDLFIVAGELLMLRAALLRQGADYWAIGLTVVGSLGSIALNVLGVGAGAAVLAYVVAAVPPTAALLAFGALMRQIHVALLASEQPDTDGSVVPAGPPVQPQPNAPEMQPDALEAQPQPDAVAFEVQPHVAEVQPFDEAAAVASAAAAECASPAGQGPDAVRELRSPDADAALLAAAAVVNAAALTETGRSASLRRLQSELGIGQRRAQRIRVQLEAGVPAPAPAPA